MPQVAHSPSGPRLLDQDFRGYPASRPDLLPAEGGISDVICISGSEVPPVSMIVTGDARATAEAVAKTLGIDDVIAEVQPADKAHVIERLQKEGRRVAMAVVPIMLKARRGVIVNMSSISAAIGQKNVHFGYNASKAAITLLTKSTAVQYGQDGIRCNSVHPELMPPMRTSGNVKDPVIRAKLIDRIPLGRSGELKEIVDPVVFLASDEASYITGAQLYVDGGYTAT
jgi:Enoyl-(Acyl carrier protein) reductase/haloacid dehalogenase-like hydrolase